MRDTKIDTVESRKHKKFAQFTPYVSTQCRS